ncbi:MAG: LPS export ABC transporter permease LptF [bacterium]|nr:LPS export ABC transporter permease LptF [bacterium]
MSILTRYILREHIAPFIYSLALIVFIFVLNLLFQMLGKVVGKGLEWSVILEFFFLNLAWIVSLAIPMSVLVSVLTTFSRLSADLEIIALRASGVSLFRLMKPVLFASVILAAAMIYFNGWMLPEFNHRLRELHAAITRKRPVLAIEAGVFNFDLGRYVLLADSMDHKHNKMHRLLIQDEAYLDRKTTIRADEGTLHYSNTARSFVFTMNRGVVHRFKWATPENYEVITFDSAIVKVPATDVELERGTSTYRSDREMTLKMMIQNIREMKQRNDTDPKLYNSLMVELHKKFSIPTACILFVIIAVPLGARLQRGGMGLSAALSTFFFLVYWVFLIAGEDYADRNVLPAWVAMWTPNILMFLIGIVLFLTTTKQGTAFAIPFFKMKKKDESLETESEFDIETAERLLKQKQSEEKTNQ